MRKIALIPAGGIETFLQIHLLFRLAARRDQGRPLWLIAISV
jgi:hypothetical protein